MHTRHTSILILLVSAIGILAGGCTQQIMPATSHPPSNPDLVKMYEKKPAQYEKLGLIEVPIGGDVRWDEKGDSKRGFQLLREKAAALGATGVLLELDPGQYQASVNTGDGAAQRYLVPLRTNTNPPAAIAEAIYVLKP